VLRPAFPRIARLMRMDQWFVYLIECRGESIYTGIATDVDRRYAMHVAGKGARYTRSHPPLRLLARFAFADRSAASRAEYAIKQFSPAQKRALCAGTWRPEFLAGQSIGTSCPAESTPDSLG
jgi:putative endonuclease